MASVFNSPLFRNRIGKKSINNEDKLGDIQVAEDNGHKFIHLKHRIPSNITEKISNVDDIKVRSFQDHMTKVMTYRVAVVPAGCLMFIPDPSTGVRHGFLLDTSYNREMLATHLMEHRWDIMDPEVLEDVRKIAATKKIEVDTSRHNETVAAQKVTTPSEAAENMTKEQLEDIIKKEQEALDAKKKILGNKVEVPEGTTPPQVAGGMSPDKAKTMVHAKYAQIIEELKKESPKHWYAKKEYRDKIKPEIDMLVSGEVHAKETELANANN